MKNKKIIIIVICIVAVILFGYFGYVFFIEFNKNNYDAEKYTFKDCDEVVIFLKNIYDTDEVKILSNSNGICEVEGKSQDGEVYKYKFDENAKLLLSEEE